MRSLFLITRFSKRPHAPGRVPGPGIENVIMKKAQELYLCSFLLAEAFALPIIVGTSNAEAHAYMI